jgi:hypothetical protein
MAKEWTSKGDSRSRYLEVTELMIGKVEKAESLKHEVDWFALIDECEVDSGMKRGGIMKVLRHGLTGRKVRVRTIFLQRAKTKFKKWLSRDRTDRACRVS